MTSTGWLKQPSTCTKKRYKPFLGDSASLATPSLLICCYWCPASCTQMGKLVCFKKAKIFPSEHPLHILPILLPNAIYLSLVLYFFLYSFFPPLSLLPEEKFGHFARKLKSCFLSVI